MSEKRRDSRGRVLRFGESQRPDGRYQFKYQDNDGKVKFAYSWRWTRMTARLPERDGSCLCGKKRSRLSMICLITSSPTAGI